MSIQIKMSGNDSILLNVWIDKFDEEKNQFVNKTFHIHVRGEHLSICGNDFYPMEISWILIKHFKIRSDRHEKYLSKL